MNRYQTLQLLRTALAEKWISQDGGEWKSEDLDRLVGCLDDMESKRKGQLRDTSRLALRRIKAPDRTTVKNFLVSEIQEEDIGSGNKKKGMPQRRTYDYLAMALGMGFLTFLQFENCVIELFKKQADKIAVNGPILPQIKRYLEGRDAFSDEVLLAEPNHKHARQERNRPAISSPPGMANGATGFDGLENPEEETRPLSIVIENVGLQAAKGNIIVEFDLLPHSGYRSATLIYRGRGGNFQRPITSILSVPTNLESDFGLVLKVPESLPENPESAFATATFQILGHSNSPGDDSIGKVSFQYQIWDHERHAGDEYMEIYFMDITMRKPSTKFKVVVNQLK